MFEKLKETVRGWFADPRVDELDVRITTTRNKTFEEIDRVERFARDRIDILSDCIDKNAMYSNEKFKDIADLRRRIEYLERRLKGDLFHLTANDVAVAKATNMSLEDYARNKLELMCNPPKPIKRGRPKGSKNKPKPIDVKLTRKPRPKK